MQNECAAPAATVNVTERAEIESVVMRIWAGLLDMPSVEREDNFLLLGGESLLAVQAASAIREELGCEIPIRSIFTHTVGEIASEIATRIVPA